MIQTSSDSQAQRWIGWLGQRSLGVYVTQFLFVDMFRPMHPTWLPAVWLFVLSMSIASDGLLRRFGLTRALFLGAPAQRRRAELPAQVPVGPVEVDNT